MTYVGEGTIEETLYLLPPDAFAERWTGRRIKEEEAEELRNYELQICGSIPE